ncbi:glutathione S-transferase [Methylophilus sp. UBA6697]|jgi:glutathione S-transferase|uniref:glutathione S-transferase n=1 Tax=Methylophilus sp. UBA6697 TaxID=1946902 RepID=UPI000EE99CF2|nr:glutathione S-transferase [Methylophilus sp. UBA6697]HCU84849.1 glutathione S-transferase [Methylophilus sp.]
MALPILYSYRRCPYAMRARVALWAAQMRVEVREVSLRDKPAHLLQISPKGTVPVLQLTEGTVLEQSLDIMLWALAQRDPQGWLNADRDTIVRLIAINDGDFKKALDRYKYPERYPEQPQVFYRQQGEQFLQLLEAALQQHRFVLGDSASMADVAIFPFIRQFAAVDAGWFAGSAYPQLRAWLNGWLESALFAQIMQKFPTYIEST